MKKKTWLVLLLSMISAPAWAADALTNYGVVLLQPQPVMQERVPDIPALAAYLKSVLSAAQATAASDAQHAAHGGFIVMAVRPHQKSKVWLDFTPPLPREQADALLAGIRRITPFEARGGTVVFALRLGIWGGPQPSGPVPSPAEWTAAAKKAGRPMEIGQLVDSIWRD